MGLWPNAINSGVAKTPKPQTQTPDTSACNARRGIKNARDSKQLRHAAVTNTSLTEKPSGPPRLKEHGCEAAPDVITAQ
jgi:hypothetical protein